MSAVTDASVGGGQKPVNAEPSVEERPLVTVGGMPETHLEGTVRAVQVREARTA